MRGERRTRRVAHTRTQARVSRGLLLLLCGGTLVAGLLIVMFSLRAAQIGNLRDDLHRMDIDLQAAVLARAELETQLASQDDLDAIETAARDLFGWVMPGEIKVIFVEPAREVE